MPAWSMGTSKRGKEEGVNKLFSGGFHPQGTPGPGAYGSSTFLKQKSPTWVYVFLSTSIIITYLFTKIIPVELGELREGI